MPSGNNSLFVRGFSIGWDEVDQNSYLHQIEALRNCETFAFHKPVTFFAGENGTGKSTLLEALAVSCGFNPEGGSKNYRFSTYDSHSRLWEAMHLQRGPYRESWGYFLRAESFYNVATKEMDYADGDHPSERYHEKSHGESFLKLIQNHFYEEGLYFLDEPEAALSPQRQLTLLLEICNRVKTGSQFIIATHSPILMGIEDAEIIDFDDGHMHSCSYEETMSYRITKMFVTDRKQILRHLLEDK